jgi:hypothetical protein
MCVFTGSVLIILKFHFIWFKYISEKYISLYTEHENLPPSTYRVFVS